MPLICKLNFIYLKVKQITAILMKVYWLCDWKNQLHWSPKTGTSDQCS